MVWDPLGSQEALASFCAMGDSRIIGKGNSHKAWLCSPSHCTNLWEMGGPPQE